MNDRYTRVTAPAGFDGQRTRRSNALRHSYASYWLARSSKEGLGELSKRMGNSEAVCKRHYLETLTREEGGAWFKIRRSKAGAEPVLMNSAKAA
jgi:hypothetical protein